MVDEAQRAKWVFVYKFNAASFPTSGTLASCLFGGDPKRYASSQHYVVAESAHPSLGDGPGLIGTSTSDPVGATFARIYASGLNFVVWNDQFYRHPPIAGCGESCGGPWGHSKGVIAWDALGRGIVMQVTTPSWPGSGTAAAPRRDDGNTLGCISDDDVKAAQHFFAVRLTPTDTAHVLDALANASVVTDIANPQLARVGGPAEIRQRLQALGRKSQSSDILDVVVRRPAGLQALQASRSALANALRAPRRSAAACRNLVGSPPHSDDGRGADDHLLEERSRDARSGGDRDRRPLGQSADRA